MSKKIRITIGTGCGLRKNGTAISHPDRSRMTYLAKRYLLDTCGGYTVTQSDGGWRDEDGKDWEEPSLGFVVIMDKNKANPEGLAMIIRDTFEQVCVMLTVEPVNTKFI